jgi:alditol oxidase
VRHWGNRRGVRGIWRATHRVSRVHPDPDPQLSAPPRAVKEPASAPAGRPRTNWAGNIAFSAPDFHRPATLGELRAVVAGARQLRVVATGHSFNDMADSPGAQVSLAGLAPEVEVDSAASRVRVAAGLSYAALAGRLDRQGFALHNLASLPHISVAGACATGTHGSGLLNQSLAAATSAMEFVTADGDLAELRRDSAPDAFPGAVVHLGALGVVTHLVLEIVPSFDVSQRVYEDLPLEVLDDHFAGIMAAGYSVSMFTDWRAPRLTQLWIKQRADAPGPPPRTTSAPPAPFASPVTEASWFTARPATAARNPVPGLPPDNCTQQLGVPGPWFERLPHFRPEFTPSAGDELQSEYLLQARHAVPALRALRQIGDRLAPVLRICEIRMIAADDLWLSPCYRRDSVAFHFTWIPDTAAVPPVAALIEQRLAPFAPRPHWGKIFTTPPAELRARYERLPDLLALMDHYDPTGKFRNAYTTRYLTH